MLSVESKLEVVNSRIIKATWGNSSCNWDYAKSEGSSSGIISIWNPAVFRKVSSWCCKYFLVTSGYLVEDGKDRTVINIYAPNYATSRNDLWDQLSILIEQRKDECLCLIGDFNSIHSRSERSGSGSYWNRGDIANFNNFILDNNLVDLQLSRRKYTWYRPNGTCKSRLDRMLVNAEWVSKWLNLVLLGGRRTLSDHRPIFIEAPIKDWGPKPFCLFNHWIRHPSFKSFVEDKWGLFNIQGWGSYVLKEKLKLLKGALKEWKKENLGDLDKSIEEKKCEIERLDIIDDTFGLDDDEARKRENMMEELMKESSWIESQLFQKARLKWISEGDVNS